MPSWFDDALATALILVLSVTIGSIVFVGPWVFDRITRKQLSRVARQYSLDYPVVAQMIKANPYQSHTVLECGLDELLVAMDWAESFARDSDTSYYVRIYIEGGRVNVSVKVQGRY